MCIWQISHLFHRLEVNRKVCFEEFKDMITMRPMRREKRRASMIVGPSLSAMAEIADHLAELWQDRWFFHLFLIFESLWKFFPNLLKLFLDCKHWDQDEFIFAQFYFFIVSIFRLKLDVLTILVLALLKFVIEFFHRSGSR